MIVCPYFPIGTHFIWHMINGGISLSISKITNSKYYSIVVQFVFKLASYIIYANEPIIRLRYYKHSEYSFCFSFYILVRKSASLSKLKEAL